jgi:hypothetical protein
MNSRMNEKPSRSIDEAYPRRIATFIDILGFSRDVLQIELRPGLFISIDAVLRHIWMCKRDLDGARETRGVTFDARMTQFSDCLVTSYLPTEGAVLRTLSDAAFLSHVILRAGYLPRGAITLGRLYHDDVVVYGQALVEAAELEKNAVQTPRILIAAQVMSMLRRELDEAGVPELEQAYVLDDGAGPYVHVLGAEWPFLKKERLQEEAGEFHGNAIQELFQELRAGLPLRFSLAPNDRARRKVEWMRDYVNRTLSQHGLGEEYRVALPLAEPPKLGVLAHLGLLLKRMVAWVRGGRANKGAA